MGDEMAATIPVAGSARVATGESTCSTRWGTGTHCPGMPTPTVTRVLAE